MARIRNKIAISAPFDLTWSALDDIPRLARCAPGAELIEQREDGVCLGTVGVALGPIALKFKGTVAFLERDRSAGRVVVKAKGNEEKGRGAAGADVVFTLSGNEETTTIEVDSDVQLAGAVAQYGRGAALIQATAQALMDQFARNLEGELNGMETHRSADISMSRVVAQGLWSAGAQIFRKKDDDK